MLYPLEADCCYIPRKRKVKPGGCCVSDVVEPQRWRDPVRGETVVWELWEVLAGGTDRGGHGRNRALGSGERKHSKSLSHGGKLFLR